MKYAEVGKQSSEVSPPMADQKSVGRGQSECGKWECREKGPQSGMAPRAHMKEEGRRKK